MYCVSMLYVLKLPGPPASNFLFGNFYHLSTTPDKSFQILRKWAVEYYPNFSLWIGPVAAVNIFHPEDMGLILGNSKHNEKNFTYKILSPSIQNGLLLSSGEKWAQRRKILNPAFHVNILQDFILTFNEKTQIVVYFLKNESHKPFVEINEMINNFALKVIIDTVMGIKLDINSAKEKAFVKDINKVEEIITYRFFNKPYLILDCLYIFSFTYFKESKILKNLHGFVNKLIGKVEKELDDGANSGKKKRTILDLLIAKKKEGEIDDVGIREEVYTFNIAGYDTVSSAISFGLMLIACHPEIQEEIVREMSDVLGNIKKSPNYNDLQEFKFMERCIKEILRLYPSVHYIGRKTGEDVVLHNGYKIKKNTVLSLMIYDLHHDPNIYPDPERFDPDRFLPENCINRHPYAYIPFSAGQRNCIGQKYAMLEMKAVFCGLLANFILEPVDTPDTIVLCTFVTLKSKDPIKVKFVPRK